MLGGANPTPATDLVKLTLAYRTPLAWNELLSFLSRTALPGAEVIERGRYGRTVGIDGHRGVVFAADDASKARCANVGADRSGSAADGTPDGRTAGNRARGHPRFAPRLS
jgi:hypothetical protein